MPGDRPSVVDIRDLPPREKLVNEVVQYDGPRTLKQLLDRTRLSSPTVRYALEQLEDAGIVAAEIRIPVARQRMYSLQRDVEPATPRTAGGATRDQLTLEEMEAIGGRDRIPFLVDRQHGVERYESDDIVDHLEEHYS